MNWKWNDAVLFQLYASMAVVEDALRHESARHADAEVIREDAEGGGGGTVADANVITRES